MEMFNLESSSFNAVSLGILILICFFTILGLIGFRYCVGEKRIQQLHDVASQYLTVISTIYAVTLGLIVFDSLGVYEKANITVKNEATALAAIYSLSDRYPDREKQKIQNLVYQYARAVVESEFQLMAKGEECPLSRKLMHDLIREINSIEPQSPSQLSILPILTSKAIESMEAARQRLQESGESIPEIEWFSLLLGGFVTIFFTYFFVTHQVLQVLMLLMISAVIGTNLILVMAFAQPYSGVFHVSDSEFRQLIHHIESLRE